MKQPEAKYAAKKKVTAPPPKPRRRIGLWIALILTACLALFIGWMHLNARILHVRYAEVHIGEPAVLL